MLVDEARQFRVLDAARDLVRELAPPEATGRYVRWAAGLARQVLREREEGHSHRLARRVPLAPILVTALAVAEEARVEDRAVMAAALRHHDRAFPNFDRTLALLDGLDLDELTPSTAIAVLLARVAGTFAPPERPRQVELSKRALALARVHGNPYEIAESWWALVFWQIVVDGAEAAAAACTEMLDYVEHHEVPPHSAAIAWMVGADLALRLRDLPRAVELLERSMALLTPESPSLGIVAWRLMNAVRHLGSPQRVLEPIREAYRQVEETGITTSVLTAGSALGFALLWSGRVSEAEELATELLARPETSEDPWRIHDLNVILAWARMSPDALSEVRALAETAARERRRAGEADARMVIAATLHRHGAVEDAHREYARIETILADTDWKVMRQITQCWHALAAAELNVSGPPVPPPAGVPLSDVVATLTRAALAGEAEPPGVPDGDLWFGLTRALAGRLGGEVDREIAGS